jgi:hypothetical protein
MDAQLMNAIIVDSKTKVEDDGGKRGGQICGNCLYSIVGEQITASET